MQFNETRKRNVIKIVKTHPNPPEGRELSMLLQLGLYAFAAWLVCFCYLTYMLLPIGLIGLISLICPIQPNKPGKSNKADKPLNSRGAATP